MATVPDLYTIRIKGQLEASARSAFLTMASELAGGETLLTCFRIGIRPTETKQTTQAIGSAGRTVDGCALIRGARDDPDAKRNCPCPISTLLAGWIGFSVHVQPATTTLPGGDRDLHC